MRGLIARLRGGEGGFALPAVLMALVIVTTIGAVVLSSVTRDLPIAKADQGRKSALDAAQSGLAWYAFQLEQDPAYWTRCTNVPRINATTPAPVNDRWSGVGADTRIKRAIPGSGGQYTIELLSNRDAGYSRCIPSTESPTATAASMLTDGTTLRIKATGFADGEVRSVIGTFKRRSFMDYVYFTDFETNDPVTYSSEAMRGWAATACARYYRDGRSAQRYGSSSCGEIQFTTGDAIRGPLHTNDELLACGKPAFGRNKTDRIEVSGASPGWRSAGCSGTSPTFTGLKQAPAPPLALPPTNASLQAYADPANRFAGKTIIQLSGTTMTVTNTRAGLNNAVRTIPVGGVIYVAENTDAGKGCGVAYKVRATYTEPEGCGNVFVRGSASVDVTIAAANDVIIYDDVTKTNGAMIGLIANNFVRIYHPVSIDSDGNCRNTADVRNLNVQAGILAVTHSFIVDNYDVCPTLGTLTVTGAIAQKYRGPVGTGSGSSATTGYLKAYGYDDRLAYRDPPHFLDPLQASWRPVRQVEQTGAR